MGEEGADEGLVFYGFGQGAYRLRTNLMGDIPLSPGEGETLGQQFWGDQWFRLRLEVGLRPALRLVGEADVFDGLVFGQFTRGVEAAEHAREDATAFPGAHPRKLFLEWRSALGVIRGGLTTTHWGLGLVDNDGDHEPLFGDYRYGDVVWRVGWESRGFGPRRGVHLTAAADWVFDDLVADVRDGDDALRAIVGGWYQEDERVLGLYAIYRRQRSEVQPGSLDDDALDQVTLDAFARWDWEDPSGGTLRAAVEAAYTFGAGELTRPFSPGEVDVERVRAAGWVERRTDRADVRFELGYASGDDEPRGDALRAATIHPDHRVGLLLFPEVLAWQTARAATLAEAELFQGRVTPFGDFAPTNGGVRGAVYLFPTVTWRIVPWMEARFGAVWARATSDVVDPYRFRTRGQAVNYRGGDASNRDLGLELDAGLRVRGELNRGIELSAGLEGAVLFPGHAFDDAEGDTMGTLGLARVLFGMTF